MSNFLQYPGEAKLICNFDIVQYLPTTGIPEKIHIQDRILLRNS
jgi:hypothetical protein